MTEEQKLQITHRLKKRIFEKYNLNQMEDDVLEQVIEHLIAEELQDTYLTIEERVDITERIFNSIRGLGLLDSIINDDEKQLEDIIQKIVGQAGREVNQANPIVDTRLPDGSRVNVVLPPISLNGATVTIRKFSKTPMAIEQLLKYGSITREVAHVLELFVKAKYNIFISGGTGSGKTTFLNAVSSFIPHDERVIPIEDSAELQIEGIENLVRMETRNANTSGSGTVTIRNGWIFCFQEKKRSQRKRKGGCFHKGRRKKVKKKRDENTSSEKKETRMKRRGLAGNKKKIL